MARTGPVATGALVGLVACVAIYNVLGAVPMGDHQSDSGAAAALTPLASNVSALLDALAVAQPAFHIATDKPLYRPGSALAWSVLASDRRTHLPVSISPYLTARICLQSPSGAVISETPLASRGTGADSIDGNFVIANGSPGGVYALVIDTKTGGKDERLVLARRPIVVQDYTPPALKVDVAFHKGSYRPGETVQAGLTVRRASGGCPRDAPIKGYVRAGGELVGELDGRVGLDCAATLSFAVADSPALVDSGLASLTVVIDDGGHVESVLRSIPITLMARVATDLVPASGWLVAGVPNTVFVTATDARSGAPVQAKGTVYFVDGPSRISLAAVETGADGRGAFSITPGMAAKHGGPGAYVLSWAETEASEATLPPVRSSGVVLGLMGDGGGAVGTGLYRAGQSVAVDVWRGGSSAGTGDLTLELVHHDEVLAATVVESGTAAAQLAIPATHSGVMVLVAYGTGGDDAESPVVLAERLVYVSPAVDLVTDITINGAGVSRSATGPIATVTPGVPVTVDVSVSEAVSGKAADGSLVLVRVVDDSVLSLVQREDRPPRLREMVHLEKALKGLDTAWGTWFEPDGSVNPRLGLALGTQAWRRWYLHDPQAFLDSQGDDAKALLGIASLNRPPQFNMRGGGGFGGDMVMEMAMPMMMRKGGKEFMADGAPMEAAGAADFQAFDDEEEADVAQEEDGNDDDGAGETSPEIRSNFAETLFSAYVVAGKDGRAQVTFDTPDSVSSFRVMVDAVTRGPPPAPFAHPLPSPRGEAPASIMTMRTWEAQAKMATPASSTDDGLAAVASFGHTDAVFNVALPFYLIPSLPTVITAGDTFEASLTVVNNQGFDLDGVEVTLIDASSSVTITALNAGNDSPTTKVSVPSLSRTTVRFLVDGTNGLDSPDLDFEARAAAGDTSRDAMAVRVLVVAPGFPVTASQGGVLNAAGPPVAFDFALPPDAIPGSAQLSVKVFPSPMATLTDALASLIRVPTGCFEQTSSTVYPLVMALDYFSTHRGVDSGLIDDARAKLEAGYARLVSYEVQGGGYEWFGQSPAHEALTAYGLVEFADMARVMPGQVDTAMIARTRDWLMARRTGGGSFDLNPRSLDSFGRAGQAVTDAYIVWSLSEAGVAVDPELTTEVDALVAALESTTGDAYLEGLVGLTLLNAGSPERTEQAMVFAKRLAAKLMADGAVGDGDAESANADRYLDAGTTITASVGTSRKIETTALAALLWMRADPSFMPEVSSAVRWIASQRSGGYFGSTQGTVLALKAIIAYDAAVGQAAGPVKVSLTLDGERDVVAVDRGSTDAVSVAAPGLPIPLGSRHSLELELLAPPSGDGKAALPYAIDFVYRTAALASSSVEEAGLDLAVTMANNEIRVGESTEVLVTVTAADRVPGAGASDGDSPSSLGMVVAAIGVPGGTTIGTRRLREMMDAGRISFYEIVDGQVFVYWRSFEAGSTAKLAIEVTAEVRGQFAAPASSAFRYYGSEHARWTGGAVLSVV